MLLVIYYLQSLLAYEDNLPQEYNFPVRIYKDELPVTNIPKEMYYVYLLESPSTNFKIIPISENDINIVEDRSKPTCKNYSEATVVVESECRFNNEFILERIIRMGIVNHRNELLISDLIYVMNNGTLRTLTYTKHIELLVCTEILLNNKELPILECLYDENVDFDTIIRAIYLISNEIYVEDLNGWEDFLTDIEGFEDAFDDWKRYEDVIEGCLEWLIKEQPTVKKYIESVRKYTITRNFKKHVTEEIFRTVCNYEESTQF
ncbi:hypothetical protein NGRA_1951 [Nosema granulosis]|uniref:Uncharacterized protein n=1 Tax=Nosema granulosis TaxID=83296 RepID=A0A9P6GXK8_9MICR|nr:hypothetical protein NGRA_1951 [Nosema granulosis]